MCTERGGVDGTEGCGRDGGVQTGRRAVDETEGADGTEGYGRDGGVQTDRMM